jgi:S1-C subfamily serine protease
MTPALLALLLAAPADPSASCVRVSQPGSAGSGTVVATDGERSLVLTARHVTGTDFGVKLTVAAPDGRTVAGTLVAYDAAADLAAVEVPADLPAAAVAARRPAVGAAVRQWGCTGGGKRAAKAGTFTDYGATIQADGGDSGCGVFDAAGRLVAVTVGKTARFDPATGHVLDVPGDAHCVRLADVRRFLGTVHKRSGRWRGLAGLAADAGPVAPPPVPMWFPSGGT